VKTTKEILQAALKLIRKGWTRGAWARYGNNLPANSVTDPKACKFCSVGAIRRVALADGGTHYDAENALHKAIGSIGINSVITWNDKKGRTKDEVIKAFKTAIASCE